MRLPEPWNLLLPRIRKLQDSPPTPRSEQRSSTLPLTTVFPLLRHCPVEIQDPFDLFEGVTGGAPHSFFIEHEASRGLDGRRFSYVGTDPYLVVRGKDQVVERMIGQDVRRVEGCPFQHIQEIFHQGQALSLSHLLPFQGGGVGCLSYDLTRRFERLPDLTNDDVQFPDVYFLFVEVFVVVDRQMPGVWLVYAPAPERLEGESWEKLYQEGQVRLDALEEKVLRAPGLSSRVERVDHSLSIEGEQSAEVYQDGVRACQEFISAGDIYQANLSHRFRVEGTPQDFPSRVRLGTEWYRMLRRVNPSPHSAFLVLESDVVVSNSPERLVRLTDGAVDMRPIAGTRPRGETIQQDRQLAEELLSNQKERAEHLMLVDLVRNDLGRVCTYGSVRVDEFMTVERYSHVMHLVSQISGQLADGLDAFDIIRATFPGGTITGVPKIHCMELIERLEPVRRGMYTGSIGFIGWDGNLDLNIAIRTLLLTAQCGYLQVGAGIVADSDPVREYEETIHKAQAFFQVLTQGASE